MIPWVHEACKSWGRAQYWLLYGHNGWPSRTILGKMKEEGLVGAGHWNVFTQEFPEVLTGENLKMARAVKRLHEEPRQLVTVHYVIRGAVKWKCEKLEMPRRTYYERIGRIHLTLAELLADQESAQNSHFLCGTFAGENDMLSGMLA